jgi:hypothetical protein
MGKIVSVSFTMRHGHCAYQEETDSIIRKHIIYPNHDFSANPVADVVQSLCETLWTDEIKSAWEERIKYKTMTPEERQQAGYS